ncbi:MAG TPA: sensor histidine kinase [Cellvibrio sp.]|nr:sensor histidine kinase [Cellvibrio sp.]
MRLSEFILQNTDVILKAWDDFARKIQPEHRQMDAKELRDHAEDMLKTVAADLETDQSESERVEKAEGDKPKSIHETAAEIHAETRLKSGFPIDLLVAEYRALRASVLHLWLMENAVANKQQINDLLRFNEAIDQLLTESIGRYSEAVTTAQDVFLGTLGHDFRSPLNTLSLGTQIIMHTEKENPALIRLASRMSNSVSRMSQMLDNLMDFTQNRLGHGVVLKVVESDLALISEQVVEEFRISNPERTIRNDVQGDCRGCWDAGRVSRVYQNLISNALQYGFPDQDILVSSRRDGADVVFSVNNRGVPIPKDDHERIFEILQRAPQTNVSEVHENMGLGLYIARDIVTAHHGAISVNSTPDAGTTFTVRLPIEGKSFS